MIDIDREIADVECELQYDIGETKFAKNYLDLLRRVKEMQELVPFIVNVPTRLRTLLGLEEKP